MISYISNLRKKRLFEFYLFCLFALLTFILYFPSINNFFVTDDFIILKGVSDGSLTDTLHFFPIPMIAYRILFLIFGMNPAPARILMFFLNALVCVFVYKFSYSLFGHFDKESDDNVKLLKSFLCSLLFCVYYIHVEPLVYFSEL